MGLDRFHVLMTQVDTHQRQIEALSHLVSDLTIQLAVLSSELQ